MRVSLRCPLNCAPDELTVEAFITGPSPEAQVFDCSNGCEWTREQVEALEVEALEKVLAR